MVEPNLYVSLPKRLGTHAFVILHLLQAAKVSNFGPVNVRWLQNNSPDFHLWEIKTALRKLSDPAFTLAKQVEGGWVIAPDVVQAQEQPEGGQA